MEYIVCNKCGCPPSSKKPFFITACSHVCCDACLAPSMDFCHLCKIPTKTLKLDGNLPKNVKRLFGDPTAMATELQKRMCKILAFQKSQKTHLKKIDQKKSSMRKEQQGKIEQKTQEITGQMAKLTKIEEITRKKLKDAEAENAKLEETIKQLEIDSEAADNDNDEDFFMRNTPTVSSPSVASSNHDDDEIFEFDLLGLKNRSDSLDNNSASSNCSSQSTQPGPLF